MGRRSICTVIMGQNWLFTKYRIGWQGKVARRSTSLLEVHGKMLILKASSVSSERSVWIAICSTLWKKPGVLLRFGGMSTTTTVLTVRWTIFPQLISQPNIANTPCQIRRMAVKSNSEWYKNWGAAHLSLISHDRIDIIDGVLLHRQNRYASIG